ncbi:unnamed protein product [Sphenostylis stenocarpa]|uniref:Uncharacterized protein n=1 Tax=Sphenostylis stenocarpa TaxID=92480 RepID=A0AA86SQJ7_9FABA|nr:unnamed protein product [Sphenostylis stenocarpa]
MSPKPFSPLPLNKSEQRRWSHWFSISFPSLKSLEYEVDIRLWKLLLEGTPSKRLIEFVFQSFGLIIPDGLPKEELDVCPYERNLKRGNSDRPSLDRQSLFTTNRQERTYTDHLDGFEIPSHSPLWITERGKKHTTVLARSEVRNSGKPQDGRVALEQEKEASQADFKVVFGLKRFGAAQTRKRKLLDLRCNCLEIQCANTLIRKERNEVASTFL